MLHSTECRTAVVRPMNPPGYFKIASMNSVEVSRKYVSSVLFGSDGQPPVRSNCHNATSQKNYLNYQEDYQEEKSQTRVHAKLTVH